MTSPSRPPNRLAGSTSPYLLQHAHNPVDWHPWGEEALARARAEDKPILLSIGYSACHWCHVMERESFENEDIAALMNRDFVCIKVDREERPDLDDVYMAATLALNHGQGGWPMTVFLTPEQEPFFAGTYFPPDDRYGRPGFPHLLERIAEAWKTDRARLRDQGSEVVAHLRQGASPAPGGALGEQELRKAAAQLAADFDERFGGFGAAPKFPPSGALMLLLRTHRRFADERALAMVRKTLDEMARGGMYDQLAGGFHRYSVDERWLVPHFEKMLYDNALLARAYLEGYQATGDAFYARVAREVLDYVRREMTAPEGGFYSATDADSEGEEGRFFVWTMEQLQEVLGDEDARVFGAYYDVDARGNWEGHSILNTSRTGPRVAKSLGLSEEALEERVAPLRARLMEARAQRVPPALDDKVLTAWNGLMISAFAEGARVLGDAAYLDAGLRAARFVLDAMRRPDGGLLRSWRAGRAGIAAFLEDYAYFGESLVDLYEAGGAEEHLHEALAVAERIRGDFAASDGGFYSTAADGEPLVLRHREGHDGAIPSANARAALLLARLSVHFDRADLRRDAESALRAYGKAIARQPRAFAWSLMAADFLLEGPVELALVGGGSERDALWRSANARFLPNRVIAHQESGGSALPLLAGKTPVNGRAALYVCRNFACQAPVTEVDAVGAALDGWNATAPPSASLGPAPLAGHATDEGTQAYADRHSGRHPYGFAPLGRSGLTVSRLGFGGYRVDDETPVHRAALVRALRAGCNLVDTSTNYTDGGSERLIGEVVRDLVADGTLKREEVVVVTKVGYVQGSNLELAEQREEEGRPFPEMVKYAPGIWHCIHPEFLRDQLARSRERLGLATLDVCLLHNPEYFLKDEHERSHGTLDKRREEFYARLRAAFACLEEEVASGRLRAYGVSSNTVTAAADDPEATSLERMLAAAAPAASFRVLQLPFNLIESGAVRERSHGPERSRTVLDVARSEGVAVLVNRPLNAFGADGLIRLADVPDAGPVADWDAQLDLVARLEAEFRDEVAARLQTAEGALPPEQFFRWSDDLRAQDVHVRSLDHWDQLEAQRIVPRVSAVLKALDDGLTGPLAEDWQAWRARYLPELRRLLDSARGRAAARSARGVGEVRWALEPILGDRPDATLSQIALWALVSTPGVSAVLVGMRREAYVDDAMAVLDWPPLPEPAAAFERTAALGKG
ncbi:MAG TPA: aldo/keto reductase [Vicinamibacteria bacterium]|nr:aldo/keto reductase [Vicinamibacteria bacterium]